MIASALAKVVTDLLTATLGAVSGGQWIARIAGLAILVIGVFAALNQLQIAPEIVNGLYYAILVTIVGSAVVAIGGGGIQTMRHLLGTGEHEPRRDRASRSSRTWTEPRRRRDGRDAGERDRRTRERRRARGQEHPAAAVGSLGPLHS